MEIVFSLEIFRFLSIFTLRSADQTQKGECKIEKYWNMEKKNEMKMKKRELYLVAT